MEKLRILIADDHRLFREAWFEILNKSKLFKVVAHCGTTDEAIKLVGEKNPDVVLMDINMSPMSGLEASQEILRNSPRCKIIGVSMHAEPAFAIKMLQIGAKGYVTKNSSQEEMIDAILEVQKGNKYICEEIKNNMLGKMLDENADGSKINTLTLREIQIINLIKEGFSSPEIAADLQLAVGTIESHRYNILKKLNLKNAASLVNFVNNNSNFISN